MVKILLIGRGRLAKHLVHWNRHLEQPNDLLFWNRDQEVAYLEEKLNQVEVVWLCISDSQIVPFFEKFLQSRVTTLKIVHFSGALSHPTLFACHPLMTFSDALYESDVYNRIHFTISTSAEMSELLPGFPNQSTKLNDDQRARYHAYCVMAGNFPQLLWNELLPEFSGLNIPQSAVFDYIQQSTKNFLKLGSKALTGPIVRGDLTTAEKNLKSLSMHRRLYEIYRTFLNQYYSGPDLKSKELL